MKFFTLYLLFIYTAFSSAFLAAESLSIEQYELISTKALEMAQYHPDKAKEMNKKLALQLEADLSSLPEPKGHLYYNLGNLWYHADELGKSLFWYRKAESQYPNSKLLKHNIEIVLQERLDALPTSFLPAWIPYGDMLLKFEPIIFIFWFMSFIYLLTGISLSHKRQQALQPLKVRAFVSAAILCIWLSFLWLAEQKSDGIILDSEIIARKGNGLIFSPAFTHPLHEGTEVIKLEERSGWVFVQLSNGERCWLPDQSIGWIQ